MAVSAVFIIYCSIGFYFFKKSTNIERHLCACKFKFNNFSVPFWADNREISHRIFAVGNVAAAICLEEKRTPKESEFLPVEKVRFLELASRCLDFDFLSEDDVQR